MKPTSLLIALSMLALASCGQKICPAYSKSKTDKQEIFVKNTSTAKTQTSRI